MAEARGESCWKYRTDAKKKIVIKALNDFRIYTGL